MTVSETLLSNFRLKLSHASLRVPWGRGVTRHIPWQGAVEEFDQVLTLGETTMTVAEQVWIEVHNRFEDTAMFVRVDAIESISTVNGKIENHNGTVLSLGSGNTIVVREAPTEIFELMSVAVRRHLRRL